MRRRGALGAHIFATVAALAVLLGAFHADAQRRRRREDPATVQARTLFEEGVTLADRGSWREASQKFREALALRDAPAIRYNLASALFELGSVTEASTELALVHSDATTPEAIAGLARDLQGRIDAVTGTLTVELAGASDGVDVFLDGEPLSPESRGSPLVVSVGAHAVTGERGGREVAREDIDVAAGEPIVARLYVAPPADETARLASPEAPVENDEGGGPGAGVWIGVTLGVVAAAAVVVVLVIVLGATPEPVQGDLDPGVITWP